MSHIPESAELADLPEYWQNEVRKLRVENRQLRGRLKQEGISANSPLEELPAHWVKTIKDLRAENARYRTERREAQVELEALKAQPAK